MSAILNDRERKITVRWRGLFEEALDSLNESIELGLAETTPFIDKIHRDALTGMIDDLDMELKEYDERKAAQLTD